MKKFILFLALVSFSAVAQPVGMQLYSLRDQLPKDLSGYLAKTAAWGITELEGGGTYGLSVPEFLKLCAQHKLKMVSIGADYNDLDKNVQKVVADAKAFGVKYVMCAWIPHAEGPLSMSDANKAVEVFNRAGKVLAENGISLCYHMHGYEFTAAPAGTVFDEMVKGCDPRYINFELDVYWAKQGSQDPLALLKKYPNRFPLLHLKDRKHGTPDTTNGHQDVETNVVLGTGDVGIGGILAAAPALGVKHYFIEDESSRVEQQIPESVKFIRKYLK
jgi:sugar phosphate isomerase/epimerase